MRMMASKAKAVEIDMFGQEAPIKQPRGGSEPNNPGGYIAKYVTPRSVPALIVQLQQMGFLQNDYSKGLSALESMNIYERALRKMTREELNRVSDYYLDLHWNSVKPGYVNNPVQRPACLNADGVLGFFPKGKIKQ